jgi:hypothetical protein
MRNAITSALFVLAAACGDDTPAPMPLVIEYRPTEFIARDDPRAAGCALETGPSHIHVGWLDWARVNFREEGAVLRATPPRPAAGRHSFHLVSVHGCLEESLAGAATMNVYANDVLLTQVVSIWSDFYGTLPGLSLTIDEEGNVSP